jgi:hypothetical protein
MLFSLSSRRRCSLAPQRLPGVLALGGKRYRTPVLTPSDSSRVIYESVVWDWLESDATRYARAVFQRLGVRSAMAESL